jgi:thiol-disulfide isomerase/thioredoxin
MIKIVRIKALWCMSCLVMEKTWKKLFQEFPDIEIIDYDYDDNRDKIDVLEVGNVLPLLIIYKDDNEITRISGEKSYKEMIDIFRSFKL